MGKELRIDGLECFLIDHPAGTLLLQTGNGRKEKIKKNRRSANLALNNEQRESVTAPTHVLEASVEGLQLLPGELGLSLQLVQTLRLVPHRGELQVAVAAVCEGRRHRQGGLRGVGG